MNEDPRLFDLVIRGGTVVTAASSERKDVGILAGRIAALGQIDGLGKLELDARELLVLPGGVDPHVHLSYADHVMGNDVWVDDFDAGSRAAFAGGVTTLGNMTFVQEHESLQVGLARERELVSRQASADVFVHPILLNIRPSSVDEARAVWAAGQPSLKLFMSTLVFDAHFAGYVRAIEAAAQAGAITLIHCEDGACIACCTELLVRDGHAGLQHYARSRPAMAELLSVQRAIALGELTGCPIYIVHLSTADALEACDAARRAGRAVFVETRPMYLHLTEAAYEGAHAGLYVGQPPLRSARDSEALWAGLIDGRIDTIGSDHAPWTASTKLAEAHNLLDLCPGVAELETMLPMLFSEGVKKRGMSLQRFVAVSAETPARLFGLFPQKGTIRVGSDADIVVWDPECEREVCGSSMQSRAGYSIYDGMRVSGWPKWTLRRGEIVLSPESGVRATPGSGRLLNRAVHRPPPG